MSMVPRDAREALMPFREAMSQFFEESFIGSRFELLTGHAFPLDVYETDDKREYVVEASLAGLKPDDFQITVDGNTLTIQAEKKLEEKTEKKGYYMRHERYQGEMSRSITLPDRIDADRVQASYEHGLLTLHIPKTEGEQSKQIPVHVK